jgi:hypothetical protein
MKIKFKDSVGFYVGQVPHSVRAGDVEDVPDELARKMIACGQASVHRGRPAQSAISTASSKRVSRAERAVIR